MAAVKPVNPIVAVIGTTGTGKSQLAVDLALHFNGEIINADAVQMYDGLPIVTNKIPFAERRGVPHHLLGCIGLHEPTWRVDNFVKQALGVVEDVRRRGRLPILVGGTHYYTQSLLFKDAILGTSERVDDTGSLWPILNAPVSEMLQRLREVDPAMAARWHPSDTRKIRRSLEIYYKTGKRASDMYAEQEERRKAAGSNEGAQDDENGVDTGDDTDLGTGLRFPTLLLWTHTPREPLKERLRHRVDDMVKSGLIEEAQSLETMAEASEAAGNPVDKSRGVYVSIGYKEFQPYFHSLKSGSGSAEVESQKAEAIEATKSATWRYAKSQERWIRLKLLTALSQADASKSIFVLDTSSPADWQTAVYEPAVGFTGTFLNGEQLPDNFSVSAHVDETLAVLAASQSALAAPARQVRTCEVCGVSAVTDLEWTTHMTSNRHKKTVKAQAERARRNAVQHTGDG